MSGGVVPDMVTSSSHLVGFTLLTKTGGPLTKRITMAPDGSLRSDGSACIMATGLAALRVIEEEGLASHAAAMGELWRDHLEPFEPALAGLYSEAHRGAA